VWQRFVEQRADRGAFALLSVAVDADPERPRPFAEGRPFPTVVDSAGVLGRLYDFDVVPNGLFLDEHGIMRYLHVGGFDIRRPEIAQQVDALFRADFAGGEQPAYAAQESPELEVLRTELVERPDEAGLHFTLGEVLLGEGRAAEAEDAFRRATELDPDDWSAAFGLGTALYQQDEVPQALAWWRTALARDPHNFTVRKQIWMVEHPERFYPEIDFAWQQEQLKREGYTA